MPILPGLGDRLRQARRNSGLSLEELAHRSGSNRRSLYSYEKGKVDPRIGDLKVLADILGVTIGFLAGEEPLRTGKTEAPPAQLRKWVYELVREALDRGEDTQASATDL